MFGNVLVVYFDTFCEQLTERIHENGMYFFDKICTKCIIIHPQLQIVFPTLYITIKAHDTHTHTPRNAISREPTAHTHTHHACVIMNIHRAMSRMRAKGVDWERHTNTDSQTYIYIQSWWLCTWMRNCNREHQLWAFVQIETYYTRLKEYEMHKHIYAQAFGLTLC